MAKYICPVCGKIWYNVKDLAQCTAADAKAEEVNQKARETKLRDKERLATYKAELDKTYTVLKSKLDVYNSAAAAYNNKYEDKVATYTSTLTSNFSSIFSNGSKTKTQTIYDSEISKLIAEKLGF